MSQVNEQVAQSVLRTASVPLLALRCTDSMSQLNEQVARSAKQIITTLSQTHEFISMFWVGGSGVNRHDDTISNHHLPPECL